MRNREKTMDMVHGPLVKNIFLFALPLMASNLMQIAFNAADTIVVGKFSGQTALAAVGAVGPVVNLLVSLFNGLATGANIVIARQIGSGQKKDISASVHTSYFMALFSGIILMVLGIFLSPLLLHLMGTPADIIDLSVLYMRIYFAGSLPLLLYDFGSAVLRAKGDTQSPTVFLLISGVLNIILNLYTVIVLHMGVSGVAIATVISESVSAVLVTLELMREKDDTKLYLKKIHSDRRLNEQILKIGIPAGLQSMMWSISNIAVQSALNTFGSVVVAGNSAAQNIESFVYIGMMAFSQAAMTFTSQNAGAGNRQRIRQILIVVTILEFAVSFSIGAFAWRFGRVFLSFYTDDPAVVDAGMVRMWYVVFWLWLNGVLDVPACSLRGMGYSTTPTVLMLLGIVVVRVTYIMTVWKADPTLPVLYFCFPLSWLITCIVMFIVWRIAYKRELASA